MKTYTIHELNSFTKDELVLIILELQKYPIAYHTVDMAIVRTGTSGIPEVLLARKKNYLTEEQVIKGMDEIKNKALFTNTIEDLLSNMWRFPGGFVDPSDNSGEEAVLREGKEETGMTFKNRVLYIGSAQIDDRRYRDSDNKIITSFYELGYESGEAGKGFDDIAETKWFPIPELESLNGSLKHPEHGVLFKMLDRRYHFHKIAFDLMNDFGEKSKSLGGDMEKIKKDMIEKIDNLVEDVEKIVPELKSSAFSILGKVHDAGVRFIESIKQMS